MHMHDMGKSVYVWTHANVYVTCTVHVVPSNIRTPLPKNSVLITDRGVHW